MSAPVAKFQGEKRKGLRVTIWASGTGYQVSIEKSWKKKGEGEGWESRKLALFDSELSEMTSLMIQASDWLRANSEPDTRSDEHSRAKADGYASQRIAPAHFDDDEIDF